MSLSIITVTIDMVLSFFFSLLSFVLLAAVTVTNVCISIPGFYAGNWDYVFVDLSDSTDVGKAAYLLAGFALFWFTLIFGVVCLVWLLEYTLPRLVAFVLSRLLNVAYQICNLFTLVTNFVTRFVNSSAGVINSSTQFFPSLQRKAVVSSTQELKRETLLAAQAAHLQAENKRMHEQLVREAAAVAKLVRDNTDLRENVEQADFALGFVTATARKRRAAGTAVISSVATQTGDESSGTTQTSTSPPVTRSGDESSGTTQNSTSPLATRSGDESSGTTPATLTPAAATSTSTHTATFSSTPTSINTGDESQRATILRLERELANTQAELAQQSAASAAFMQSTSAAIQQQMQQMSEEFAALQRQNQILGGRNAAAAAAQKKLEEKNAEQEAELETVYESHAQALMDGQEYKEKVGELELELEKLRDKIAHNTTSLDPCPDPVLLVEYKQEAEQRAEESAAFATDVLSEAEASHEKQQETEQRLSEAMGTISKQQEKLQYNQDELSCELARKEAEAEQLFGVKMAELQQEAEFLHEKKVTQLREEYSSLHEQVVHKMLSEQREELHQQQKQHQQEMAALREQHEQQQQRQLQGRQLQQDLQSRFNEEASQNKAKAEAQKWQDESESARRLLSQEQQTTANVQKDHEHLKRACEQLEKELAGEQESGQIVGMELFRATQKATATKTELETTRKLLEQERERSAVAGKKCRDLQKRCNDLQLRVPKKALERKEVGLEAALNSQRGGVVERHLAAASNQVENLADVLAGCTVKSQAGGRSLRRLTGTTPPSRQKRLG